VTTRAARFLAWFTIVAGILVAGFSCGGYLMVGSFSVADAARLESHRQVAWIYIALMALSATAVLLASLFLTRRRRNAESRR
jgi:hypothetical protein